MSLASMSTTVLAGALMGYAAGWVVDPFCESHLEMAMEGTLVGVIAAVAMRIFGPLGCYSVFAAYAGACYLSPLRADKRPTVWERICLYSADIPLGGSSVCMLATRVALLCGADINLPNRLGITPLHMAVYCDFEDITQFLLQNGANIHAQDLNGDTPISLATRLEHKNIMKLLLKHGADINQLMCGMSLLGRAIRQQEIVQLLLEHGADVHFLTTRTDWLHRQTPLHMAATATKDIAQLLLTHGADINRSDQYGVTPLHIAARAGNVDNTRLFLCIYDAIATIPNQDGATAFYQAAMRIHTQVVQLFLKNDDMW